jgi:hypothetical protein
MTLGLTQPLTEMSSRKISRDVWVGGGLKAAGALGLTNLPPLCPDCLEIWEPQPLGNLMACPGL